MRVYLDVSCLNRPLDDQSQLRIRAESEAVISILNRIYLGEIELAYSEMAEREINAIPDAERRRRVRSFLPPHVPRHILDESIIVRARALKRLGIHSADALHVAFAEAAKADILLSCDDQLCRIGRRNSERLNVQVANPVDWLESQSDDTFD